MKLPIWRSRPERFYKKRSMALTQRTTRRAAERYSTSTRCLDFHGTRKLRQFGMFNPLRRFSNHHIMACLTPRIEFLSLLLKTKGLTLSRAWSYCLLDLQESVRLLSLRASVTAFRGQQLSSRWVARTTLFILRAPREHTLTLNQESS